MTAVDPRFAHVAIRLRVDRGWSVERLAAEADLEVGSVHRIECGRPVTPAEAAAIAGAFALSVESMLDDGGDR